MEVLPKVYHYKGIDFVALGLKVERSTLIDPVNVRVAKTQTTSKKVLFDGEEDYVGGCSSRPSGRPERASRC